jgi:hypothetical protein
MRSIQKLNEPPEKMFKFYDGYEDCNSSEEIVPYMNNSNEDVNKPKELFKACLYPNGYIDVIPVKTLIKTKTVYGNRILGFQTEKVTEIDSQDDFDYLEYQINKG